MAWQDEHQDQIEGFPTQIRDAHEHSINHRAEIESSKLRGFFYCRAQFTPDKIDRWVDDDPHGKGSTALCPLCGIDSVLGDSSGFPITPEFLAEMHRYWFQ
jgi:hypothetical protein